MKKQEIDAALEKLVKGDELPPDKIIALLVDEFNVARINLRATREVVIQARNQLHRAEEEALVKEGKRDQAGDMLRKFYTTYLEENDCNKNDKGAGCRQPQLEVINADRTTDAGSDRDSHEGSQPSEGMAPSDESSVDDVQHK